ncbi:hypothetical protein [Nocardia anaemiae]|uniref:hypothetical protein n=1 Tax=Nocardia anaemiae TaxID=263910 RepID=UPI0014716151|nr:hypothetical protein [Nocardia anaemiae]
MLKETAAEERRVALIPEDVRGLADVRVVVEHDAGRSIGFDDADYVAAGAQLGERAEIFARSDVVVWVKPPAYQLDSVRPGTTLIGFQDPLHRHDVIAALRERGIESVGYETVPHSRPDIDALSAMSRIAGEVAYGQARQLLSTEGPVPALILGCGQAGLSAIAAAVAKGDEPTAMGNRREQESAAIRHGAKAFLPHPDGLLGHLAADPPALIVCAAVHRGSHGPLLLDATVLDTLRSGTVIVDLVAKSGGNCVATVPDRTVTLPNGVIVTHRSNYPTLRPEEASHAYSAVTAALLKSRFPTAFSPER